MDKEYIQKRRQSLNREILQSKDDFIKKVFEAIKELQEKNKKILLENSELIKVEKKDGQGEKKSDSKGKK